MLKPFANKEFDAKPAERIPSPKTYADLVTDLEHHEGQLPQRLIHTLKMLAARIDEQQTEIAALKELQK